MTSTATNLPSRQVSPEQALERDEPQAWLILPGQGGQAEINDWLSGGFVSLAASHIGTLEARPPWQRVHSQVEDGYQHVDVAQREALTDDYYRFLTAMRRGDCLYARRDGEIWVGRVTGEPVFVEDAPRLRRAVEWLPSSFRPDNLPKGDVNPQPPNRLVNKLSIDTEQILKMFDAIALPRATDELAAAVHSPKEWLDEYIGLLESRGQLIVYGPPGTGKTFVARRIARHVAGDNVRIVQFHPSYAYEDFFEGLRPVPAEGNVAYAVMPGPLSLLAKAAQADPRHPYVLIIDEINRADIAKVFGELYFLLEYRGDKINLQYSPDKEFFLPKNLYFIGTMNTADRSIALVDAAIRRRFPFVEMHPSEEPVAGVLASYLESTGGSPERAELLAKLNSQLTGELREFQIGPSYLMRQEAATEEGLSRIWRHDILPLLEEQLYSTYERAQVHTNFGLDAIRQAIARPKGQAEPPAAQGQPGT